VSAQRYSLRIQITAGRDDIAEVEQVAVPHHRHQHAPCASPTMNTGAEDGEESQKIMLSSCHSDLETPQKSLFGAFSTWLHSESSLPLRARWVETITSLEAAEISEWYDGNIAAGSRCVSHPQVLRLDDRAPSHLKPAKLQLRASLHASVTLQTYAFWIRTDCINFPSSLCNMFCNGSCSITHLPRRTDIDHPG
jgi:hypothetical protein